MEAWREELYHHGILGQKWGVRRFQNPDGTLTAEGRKRYEDFKKVIDHNTYHAVENEKLEKKIRMLERKRDKEPDKELAKQYTNQIKGLSRRSNNNKKKIIEEEDDIIRNVYMSEDIKPYLPELKRLRNETLKEYNPNSPTEKEFNRKAAVVGKIICGKLGDVELTAFGYTYTRAAVLYLRTYLDKYESSN